MTTETDDSTERKNRLQKGVEAMKRKFVELRYRNTYRFEPVESLDDIRRAPKPVEIDAELVKERDDDGA